MFVDVETFFFDTCRNAKSVNLVEYFEDNESHTCRPDSDNNRTEKHALLVPVVDSDYCTGCGKCEHACVTKKAAIGVVERERVIGISSDNYVKGWIKGDDAKLKDADTKINLDPQKSKDYLNEDDLMEGARQ